MDHIEKLAQEVATAAAAHADRHDREGSFVVEGVQAARDIGYLAAPVPPELGGGGARTEDIVAGQRIIARSCGSTGLALAMHLHVVLAAAWRWRRGDTVVEPTLRKVADGLVVVSTGGNDWTHPRTVATPVDGGWRVSGRKTFASISPAGGAMATFAVVGEPVDGAEVIAFGCSAHVGGHHPRGDLGRRRHARHGQPRSRPRQRVRGRGARSSAGAPGVCSTAPCCWRRCTRGR